MSRGFSSAVKGAIACILLLLGLSAAAAGPGTLPPPYDSWAPEEVAARAFGLLAGQRNVWLNDARLWHGDGKMLLAVIAEAERPNVDGAFCDCPRPTRLALMEADGRDLVTVAATLIPDVRAGQKLSLNSSLLGERLVRDGVFRLRGAELLLPMVRSWDAGGRPRAELTLYRLVDWRLLPVFTRLILDDPTVGNPELSGMRARMRLGDLDPGGVAGFADIRFVERYFTRFGEDIVELDDRRIEIWVFGGDRFSLVQCELSGPMGYGACVQ
jgi:hypothetical protein